MNKLTKIIKRVRVVICATLFVLLLNQVAYSQSNKSNIREHTFPNVNIEKQKEATSNFIIPIESYNGFAGTYGELRGNHFHCGLDMRTNGVEGKKIFAADEGYIARISVSAWGFGNMIMIKHKSGYSTIYAHLQRFAPKYQKILREKQYIDKRWEQEIEFKEGEYPVNRGELIAYSGNTGSSGGPHLHFEVRDENGIPVNLQLSDTYKLKDNTKPTIRDVKLIGCTNVLGVNYTFPIQMNTNEVKYVTKKVVKKNSKGKKYTVNQRVAIKEDAKNIIIDVPNHFYVAIDAFDYMDESPGKLAIYKYEVLVDNSLIFSFEEGNIPYSQGRYIASLLDHPLRESSGRYYVKTLLNEGNLLKDRIIALNDGIISLKDSSIHNLSVIVTDVTGNMTQKDYKIKLSSRYANKSFVEAKGKYMEWDVRNYVTEKDLRLYIPDGALYSNHHIDVVKLSNGLYSDIWRIGDPNIPLHKNAILELNCNIDNKELTNKAVIARKTTRGNLISCGGELNPLTKGITAPISRFGDYLVAIDTTLPKATFKFANGANIKGNNIKIVIGDNLSGIKNYSVEIDEHWVVAEYDGKTSTLTIPLNDAKIKKGIKHTLKINLEDMVGNKYSENRRFIW